MTVKPPLTTALTGIPYPDEETDPFFDQFVAMVAALDVGDYYGLAMPMAFVGGGGTRTWNGTTGLFTWTQDFILTLPFWGFKVSLAFGPDDLSRGANLSDGQMLVAPFPLTMNANVAANLAVASKVGAGDFPIAQRIGSALYIRNIGELV